MEDHSTIKGRYTQLSADRDIYYNRAVECAKLTIPTLMPPIGHTSATKYTSPWQTLGARGVNSLSNRIVMAILPLDAPLFRLAIDDFALEKMTRQPGMRADVEAALASIERSVMADIETSDIRVGTVEAIKHLLVAGNVMIYLLPNGNMRVYRLDQYVVKRDPSGNVLEAITRERISPMELPSYLLAAAAASPPESKAESADDTAELYTSIKMVDGRWEVRQEVFGMEVRGSFGHYPKDQCPWLPLRLTIIDNEDYGRGFVEEYIGDLKSLDVLSKAIVVGSAAAAKVLFLVKPNGTTKTKVLAESESGDVRDGNAEDVTVLQLDKYADFRVAHETMKGISDSLGHAFMLASAVQRSGERVTAEEIRTMVAELESGQAGLYSTLAQTFQLPLVTLRMRRMEREGRLPVLPKGLVRPAIATGLAALGRANDLSKYHRLLAAIAPLGEAAIAGNIEITDLIHRIASALSIDPKGLIPSKAEVQQRQAQAAQQQMVEKLGPQAISQAGGIVRDQMAPQ